MQIPTPLPGNDDGYAAWLRYDVSQLAVPAEAGLLSRAEGEIPEAVQYELQQAVSGFAVTESSAASLTYIHDPSLSAEAYAVAWQGERLELRASGEAGFLYATYALLKRLQCGLSVNGWEECSEPYYPIRILNHWDDPKFDHTLGPYNVTRGFAGNSIFDWEDLQAPNSRIRDYARLMAAAGFNASCVNNVNADPDLLESSFLPGIAALAYALRPYHIRLYLSVCFSAPMVTDGTPGEGEYGVEFPFCMRNRKLRLGCLETADPRDPAVQAWWADKVNELYAHIPDFGGFVIKANSEGMPGPQDYGCTHAEGANCIARALAPHGGTLFWRTFVYQGKLRDPDFLDRPADGNTQAYLEFKGLDGHFDDNVILQTKNGPADFRAYEPPSPLFGAVPHTRHALEVMAAQEYLGHTTHVCYQGGHWKQILDFDSLHQGPGSTVAAVTAGRTGTYPPGALVVVPNLGDDANWFGHRLAGANLYAAGRLGWDPAQAADQLAVEFIERSYVSSSEVKALLSRILNESYEVFSRYAAPLGMGAMHEACHHFEPSTKRWILRDLGPDGIGTDRSAGSGTGYVAQYHPEAGLLFEELERCPLQMRLFFHRLPWDFPMEDGRELLQYLMEDRCAAVDQVAGWIQDLGHFAGELDPQSFSHLYERLQRQWVHAGKWRDVGLAAIQKAAGAEKVPQRPEELSLG